MSSVRGRARPTWCGGEDAGREAVPKPSSHVARCPHVSVRSVSIWRYHICTAFLVPESQLDPLGRFLFLKLRIHERVYTIGNLYLPNTRQSRALSACANCLVQRFSTRTEQLSLNLPQRYLGQPSYFTHAHLLKKGEVTPGLTQTEYALRRHKLMSNIQKESQALGLETDHAAVFLSSATMFMSNDIPFPFHQNNDFLYLCGFLEPDSILLLQSSPGHPMPSHIATLFVPRRDSGRELWDGPRSGPDGAVALTGVDQAYPIEEFKHVLPRLFDEKLTLWYDYVKPSHHSLHSNYIQPLLESNSKVKNRIKSTRLLTQNLRLIKSEAEIKLMKKAGHISSHAFIETMHWCKAPVDEALIYAKFDFECRSRGAEILAYPPVVAGGNRANTLHYVNNNQIVKSGEMVLLDGGCEASCYVSDITRTWPVNGKFSAVQEELYQSVLEVQKSCLNLCTPGTSLENLYSHMLTQLGTELRNLGIVQKSCNDSRLFKAARIYIPEYDTEAPEKYRGIGIRIEDDVVITEQSPFILSAECPKEVYEIHQVCLQGH
ncbi:xaa-Pro aminopeptidase 3 isoform X3 [Bufo gargarizans]|uniref:xaa-Pro aminopeptidase 3 isoform X3 n=1 Tax=Bufo gargarizans TaxID=30331 RepID=UPI001CF1538F|nr:xaa-Pro aminopeptidase 3 isoform X3 [Bufo gargarizans]